MNTVFLTYAGPPMIGAFIGYLTNKIAIKMLFRPLKPWYIFGLRVPMTPGVIPAKRHELAENIGVMVGEHLLTARDIGAALSREPFQEHLHALVEERVNTVLAADLGSLLSLVPERFRAYARVGLRTLKYRIKDGIYSYLESGSFAAVFAAAVNEQMELFANRELNQLVAEEQRQQFYDFFDGLLDRLLRSARMEDHLSQFLQERLQQAAREGKSIHDLLPEPFVDLVLQTISSQTPALLQRLAGLIAEPKIRARIISAVIDGVDHFLSSLGPMAAMAKGFIDMDSLDGKIRDYLVDHEQELEEWLQSEDVQREFARVLELQARKMLQMPIGELLVRLDEDQFKRLCHTTAEQLLALLRTRGALETLSLLLRQSLEDMLEHGNLPVGQVFARLLPGEHGAEIREKMVCELLSGLRSPTGKRLIGRMIDRMLDTLATRPVGILSHLIPPGVRQGIADYIVLTANKMLLHEVPGLVKSLNISRLVTDKVDSLDLLRLEGLLLSIMEEQFKYINLFGAVLGFLIGLINLTLLQF